MTVLIAVTCPGCHSTDVIRNGKTSHGKQRYKCRNQEWVVLQKNLRYQ